MSTNFLHQIRTKKNVNLAELAREIGVSRQLLWSYEGGKTKLSVRVLNDLARVLNVRVEQIIDGVDIDSVDGSNNFSQNSVNQSVKQKKSEDEEEFNSVYFRDTMEILEEMVKDKNLDFDQKIELTTEIYKKVAEFHKAEAAKKLEIAKKAKISLFVDEGIVKFLTKKQIFNEKPSNQNEATPQEKNNQSNLNSQSKIIETAN